MDMSEFKNLRMIGNRVAEVTCKGCGEIFMVHFEVGEDLHLEVDANREKWIICGRCGSQTIRDARTKGE